LCGKTFKRNETDISTIAKNAEKQNVSKIDNILIVYASITTDSIVSSNKNGIDDLLFWIIAILCSQAINSINDEKKIGYAYSTTGCEQKNNINESKFYDQLCLINKNSYTHHKNVPELFLITLDTQKLNDCGSHSVCKNLYSELLSITNLKIFILSQLFDSSMDTRADNEIGLETYFITFCITRLIQSFVKPKVESDKPQKPQKHTNIYYDDLVYIRFQELLKLNYDNITKIPIKTYTELTPFKKFILLVRYIQYTYFKNDFALKIDSINNFF
jgi:hypothetical protein